MEHPVTGIKQSKKRSGLIKRQRFLLISLAILIIILIGGSISFIYSMRQIVHANKRTELLQTVEIQRYSLEASVNREINIVLEMANSQIIKEYFLNPADQAIRRIAFDEIDRFTQSLLSKSAFWVGDIEREFFLGENTHYHLDPDIPENYWYNMTMYETHDYNFNINYNPDLEVTNFWINAPVFDSNGKPIGILGTGINLTEFIKTIYRNHKGSESLYFFNNAGEITGATETDLVANKLNLNYIVRDTGPEILAWIKNYPDAFRSFRGPEGEIALCAIPVVGWFIIAVQPLDLMDYLSTSMTYLFLGIMGVIIIFFVILQIGKYAFDTINRTRQELRIERDLIATMKDNLNVGLFLMDNNFVIQGSYSKPLETILGTDEIEGKKFTAFLASSLKVKEREGLEDYFYMVLNRQFDAKMLEDVNPIPEFTYFDEVNNKEKILKTGFTSVDMGEEELFVLATMEDISATKELEKQLAQEAGKREEEMRALFQVIQIDSAVFGDFIEDIEYEFNHINETLKNNNLSTKDAMVDIYQSVHAMKSNAIILGLESFSARLHELENVIKNHRDSDEITFDDLLHVAVEIEKIMKEKDKFRNITDKIESFKTSTASASAEGNVRQDEYVLTETLTKACEKAALAMNKKAKFTIENIDASILEKGPRRIIKETLTQLVRNSVYHGIELPKERTAKGKKPEGTIQLNITEENSQIHIKLSDDGNGLDFNKIREKALDLKLLSKENANSKNHLLQVIFSPGFSTAETADAHAGRGIGLNLVRDRIKDLHGTIKLSSEPGKGTIFHLYIPVLPELVSDEAAVSR